MAIEEAIITSLPEVSPEHAAPIEPQPDASLPDFMTSPDATLGDKEAVWRYGKPPDYSRTREEWAQTKLKSHASASLEQLVENLVKNWEVEASFKTALPDWRTIDHEHYTFSVNGEPPQSAEHMLRVGTYNALLPESDYYSPSHSDFAASHKTFKRMMPTFAWEVLEVYSPPPKVAFKWRHWGTMKNDYVGYNDKGEKVTANAHGGLIELIGLTVAAVNPKMQIQAIEVYYDPDAMFRQIAPGGNFIREKLLASNGGCPFAGTNHMALETTGKSIVLASPTCSASNGHTSDEPRSGAESPPIDGVVSGDSSCRPLHVNSGANGSQHNHHSVTSSPIISHETAPLHDPCQISGGQFDPDDVFLPSNETSPPEPSLNAQSTGLEDVAVWYDCDGASSAENTITQESDGSHLNGSNDPPAVQDVTEEPADPMSIDGPVKLATDQPEQSGDSAGPGINAVVDTLNHKDRGIGDVKAATISQVPRGEQDQNETAAPAPEGSSGHLTEPLATRPQYIAETIEQLTILNHKPAHESSSIGCGHGQNIAVDHEASAAPSVPALDLDSKDPRSFHNPE